MFVDSPAKRSRYIYPFDYSRPRFASLLNGLPRWDDWFGQFGIKVSSGALRIVILVKNHPSDVYVGLTLDDYHPLGGQGALISGQYTCTHLMHMYVHGGEINKTRESSLDHDSGKNRGCRSFYVSLLYQCNPLVS